MYYTEISDYMGDFMKNQSLILITILIIALITISGGLYYYFFISDTILMKNQTFEDINVSVPSQSIFMVNPNSNTYSSGGMIGIWIIPFNTNNSSYSSIDDFSNDFIKEDMSEINITGLDTNAKAFVLDKDKNDIAILVTNNKKNMAVIIRTTNGEDLAVKMANSVVFPTN